MQVSYPKEGNGFTIRLFNRADIEHLAEIEFDPIVKKFLTIPKKPKTQWIQEFVLGTTHVAIECNGMLAGRASLMRTEESHEREFAIVIGQLFWGKNLGRKVTEILIPAAFDELQVASIVAKVDPDHKSSIALLQHFNFRKCEDVNKPESYQNGFLTYRLSKSDYEATLTIEK